MGLGVKREALPCPEFDVPEQMLPNPRAWARSDSAAQIMTWIDLGVTQRLSGINDCLVSGKFKHEGSLPLTKELERKTGAGAAETWNQQKFAGAKYDMSFIFDNT